MSRKRAEAIESTNQASQEVPAAVTQEAAKAETRQRESGDETQYPPEPNPRAWAENIPAGVQFRTIREPYEAELVFKDKPSQAVIDFIRDNGFSWNREAKVWTRPVGFKTQAQDRLIASRTYQKAVDMILKEKGLAPQPEQQPF